MMPEKQLKLKDKLLGTFTSIFICIGTILLIFFPILQLNTIRFSGIIQDFVKDVIVDNASETRCEDEIFWIKFIYLVFSIIISGLFYYLVDKRLNNYRDGLIILIIFLLMQFLILQAPYFIFEVGTYYNCKSDGQTIMALISSSFKVSLSLILFGAFYDFIFFRKRK